MSDGAARWQKRLLSLSILSGVASATSSGAARAQDVHVQDVIVSGREGSEPGELSKRKVQVQEIPRPIVVIDPKTAQREQLYRLEDFAQKIPNYNPGSGNPRTARPAIRGVSAGAGTGDGAEFDTGFMVDNVFLKHVGFQWANFIDIESAEIALGPQGTAGGKNTTVGSFVVRTQLPSFQRKTTFETQFSSYSHVLQQVNKTGSIIDDKLAYRIAAYYDRGDGWINDQVSGATYLDNNRWGARGQLLYVGDDFSNRLIFNISQSHEYNNNASGPYADTFQLFWNGTRPARSYAQNLQARLGRSALTLDPYRPANTDQGTLDQRLHIVSNELNYNIGENVFTSISAYGNFRLLPRNSQGNNLTEISKGASDTYVDQFSQEFRLTSPRDQPLEWQVGLFGFYDYVWNRSNTIFGADAARWFNDVHLLRDMRNNRDGKARDLQIAAYGNATYHVDDRLSLTVGLRDSWEVRSGSDFSWFTAVPGNGTLAEQQAAIVAGGGQRIFDTGGRKSTLNALTGIFNPQYKVTENVTVYGLVGRGEKAGAVNTAAQAIFVGGAFQKFQPVVTEPETSWDYEAGIKTVWDDGRFVLNGNFYWNDIYNFQTNFVDASNLDGNGVPVRQTYLGVAPHARLRGFEFDGRWNAFEGFWLNYSGAVIEARWIDFDDAPVDAAWTWTRIATTGPFAGLRSPAKVSRSDTRFNAVPTFQFNIGANYEIKLGRLFEGEGNWWNQPLTGFAYVNVAWQNKTQATNPDAVFTYWQPAYAITNLGFGVRTDDERVSLNVWVKNLTDQRPILNTGATAIDPGTATAPATSNFYRFPRLIGGTLRFTI
ncbi:TonB-dependent receptor [Methylosinus sp. Ce-a6]|uniref:TonB-dependent receptor n=1 Tax=Methylosinus sp. Ce-a6 TaxID=2172005 RepID=UPI00135AC132|nr:TonB-dependent receptor [Methylosinus sp. Ce-a6]